MSAERLLSHERQVRTAVAVDVVVDQDLGATGISSSAKLGMKLGLMHRLGVTTEVIHEVYTTEREPNFARMLSLAAQMIDDPAHSRLVTRLSDRVTELVQARHGFVQ